MIFGKNKMNICLFIKKNINDKDSLINNKQYLDGFLLDFTNH